MTVFKNEVFTQTRARFSLCLFAALLVALIGLAGCGGGGGGDSAASTPTVPPPAAAPGISIFAGGVGGAGYVDGSPGRLNSPLHLAVDSKGVVLVADNFNCKIRKIVGTTMSTFYSGCAINDIPVRGPLRDLGYSMAVGRDDSFYIADLSNIFKLAADGTLLPTPVASTQDSIENNSAMAQFAFDTDGVIFYTARNNYGIYQLAPGNAQKLVAGGNCRPTQSSPICYADGVGAAAKFNAPTGIVIGNDGVIYVADTLNHAIRKVTREGIVSTFAGSPLNAGSADGTGASAQFNEPASIALDAAGNFYVADSGNYTIRKITPAGAVTTLAGTAGLRGALDGIGAAARFNDVSNIVVDKSGAVFVSDSGNSAVRRISPEGNVTTVAGALPARGASDGVGGAARFSSPRQIGIDKVDNVYVADTGNATIRKVSRAGAVTTLAGNSGIRGLIDGLGVAASFAAPIGIAVDSSGDSYATERESIRKISAAGQVTTIKVYASDAIAYRPSYTSIVADGIGNVFYIQLGAIPTLGSTIQKRSSAGAESVVSCGIACAARAITTDNLGNVYIATVGTVKRIAPDGSVVNLAGDSGVERIGAIDGTGAAARFNNPAALAADNKGNVFVADTDNHTVRKITAAGVVTTIAGKAGMSGVATGNLPGLLNSPRGIVVDSLGNLFVATEDAVVKIVP